MNIHFLNSTYYTFSFTCNIYFLNQHILFSINLKVTSFHISFSAKYIFLYHIHFDNKTGTYSFKIANLLISPVLFSCIKGLLFQSISKDLDPSYKMEPDSRDCFGRDKPCLIIEVIWYFMHI